MTFWGSITAKGTILPRSIRQSRDEAVQAAIAEPLADRVAPLDVVVNQEWLSAEARAGKRRDGINDPR